MKKIILLPGFRKCGTTTLYDYLIKNQICEKGLLKEPQLLNSGGTINQAILNEYLKLFTDEEVLIDGSTFMIGCPDKINDICKNFADTKIIICLRDPVKRFFSAYWHNKGKVDSQENRTLDFITAQLNESEDKYNSELALIEESGLAKKYYGKNYLRNLYNIDVDFTASNYFQAYQYFGEGIYSKFMKELDKLNLSYEIVFLEEFSNVNSNSYKRLKKYLGEYNISGCIADTNNNNKGYDRSNSFIKYIPFKNELNGVLSEGVKLKLKKLFFKKLPKANDSQVELVREFYKEEIEFWVKKYPELEKLWS